MYKIAKPSEITSAIVCECDEDPDALPSCFLPSETSNAPFSSAYNGVKSYDFARVMSTPQFKPLVPFGQFDVEFVPSTF